MAYEPTGHGIQIIFSQDTSFALYATATTDPGISSNDRIDLSHNGTDKIMAFAPADLADIEAVSMTVLYDMNDLDKAYAIINEPGSISFVHNKSYGGVQTRVINGWLSSFKPEEATTNNAPKATIEISFGGSSDGLGGENANPVGVLS